jgi:hypothetical protein
MRIDPALCRTILIAVEGDPKAGSGHFLTITVDGYDEKTIAHHVKHLFDEGLILGQDVGHLNSPYPEIRIQDITPEGRNSLDKSEPAAPHSKIGFQ